MCIIIVKNKGAELPTKEVLANCWANNPDGAGYMFKTEDKKVHIKKGFMTLKSLIKSLKKENFQVEDTVVYHFRIGTSGLTKSKSNTHPFPLTRSINKLKQLDIIALRAVAHNGIIGDGSKKLSDTMEFVRDILGDGAVANNLHRKSIQMLINDYLESNNKLAILDGRRGVTLFGEKWEIDKVSQLWFSNDGWKYTYVYTTKGSPVGWTSQDVGSIKHTTSTTAGDETLTDQFGFPYETPKEAPYCPECERDDKICVDSFEVWYCDHCDTSFDDDGEVLDDYPATWEGYDIEQYKEYKEGDSDFVDEVHSLNSDDGSGLKDL